MKKQFLHFLLILISVFVISCAWEFFLEPHWPFNTLTSNTESISEQWEYVITATIFCALALIIPTLKTVSAEKTRKKAEAERTAIFENSAIGITISDLHGKILRTNPAYQRIFGYSRHDLQSMVFPDFTHPDDIGKHQASYQKLLAGEIDFFKMRKRFIHKDGYVVWANVAVSLIRNNNRKPLFIIGMVEDITLLVRAENKLRESEQRFRELSEMLPEAVFETDIEMNLTYANRQAFALFGYTKEEFENGLNCIEMLDPAERERAWENIAKHIKGEAAGSTEFSALRKDGSRFSILLHAAPIMLDGSVKGFRGIIIDITGLKKTEEALIQSEERFRLAFDTSPDAVNINKMDGTYVEINEGFTDLTGYTKEDVIGKTSSDIKIWDIPEDRQRLVEGLKKNGKVKNLESRFLMKDGSYRIALMSANIITLQGEPHILSITRDISDMKKAEQEKTRLEEQLRQAQKMEAVGTMAGGIAHDFNNILTIISGNAELALDEIPKDNPARDSIKEIFKASGRASDLVSQILAFSRKEKKELVPIRPQSLIKETLKLLRSTTPTTVSIVQSISAYCGKILADPTGLHQILMNLFTNAVHAIDERGEVTVELQEVDLEQNELEKMVNITPPAGKTLGKYARISVTDDGDGMDRETIERIFDPFFTTKEVGKGTGMGLSVVHGIVESHSGFIKVNSEPAKGSTFSVFIPVMGEEEGEFHKNETDAFPRQGKGRILLIDDEEAIHELGSRMLMSLGYEVVTESSSLRALEMFRSKPDQFDLIITDQSMPNMSGLEVVAEALKIRPGIPSILCTGFSSKISETNAAEKGISKYLRKPYNKKILSEALLEILDK